MTGSAFDAIVIGGGPGGATAALVLARAGLNVIVLEKAHHPRFHIGESFLPRKFLLLNELGLIDPMRKLPHMPKFGAEFGMGDCLQTMKFDFADGLVPGTGETINIDRSLFDAMVLDEARKAGATVREDLGVKEIVRLKDGDVCLRTSTGDEVTGKWLIDGSGHGTVVARHLGTKVVAHEPHLRKVAHFGHFKNVKRLPGREEGSPLIVMCDEGWFWLIPLDKERMSIGLVMDADAARKTGVPATRVLQWGMQRCPLVMDRAGDAIGIDTNHVLADFSYRCRPFAGEGHFLVGDAAAFMDPIFSTGASLAMMSGREAANKVIALTRGSTLPPRARAGYIKFVEGSTKIFFRLIREYYDHSFRELFMNGTGPVQMHRAVISILAGHVFPKPTWALRWRLAAFYGCVRLNRRWEMVPRRKHFSLLAQPAPAMRELAMAGA